MNIKEKNVLNDVGPGRLASYKTILLIRRKPHEYE